MKQLLPWIQPLHVRTLITNLGNMFLNLLFVLHYWHDFRAINHHQHTCRIVESCTHAINHWCGHDGITISSSSEPQISGFIWQLLFIGPLVSLNISNEKMTHNFEFLGKFILIDCIFGPHKLSLESGNFYSVQILHINTDKNKPPGKWLGCVTTNTTNESLTPKKLAIAWSSCFVASEIFFSIDPTR